MIFIPGCAGSPRPDGKKMDLKTTGMEFASEMVISATLKGLKISEVPVTCCTRTAVRVRRI